METYTFNHFSPCDTCMEQFCPNRNFIFNDICPKIPFSTITTTNDELEWLESWLDNAKRANENLGKAVGEEIGKSIIKYADEQKEKYSELIIKSSRLAESVLMDWNKDEQVELAKDIAVLTHVLMTEPAYVEVND